MRLQTREEEGLLTVNLRVCLHHYHHWRQREDVLTLIYRMSYTILFVSNDCTMTFISSESDSYIISGLSSHDVNEEMLNGYVLLFFTL